MSEDSSKTSLLENTEVKNHVQQAQLGVCVRWVHRPWVHKLQQREPAVLCELP